MRATANPSSSGRSPSTGAPGPSRRRSRRTRSPDDRVPRARCSPRRRSASERDENVIGRLVRGLVSFGRARVRRRSRSRHSSRSCSGSVIALVFGVVIQADGRRRRAVGAAAAPRRSGSRSRARASGALGALVGGLAREAGRRRSSPSSSCCRSSCSGSSPEVVPAAGLISEAFPFSHAARFFRPRSTTRPVARSGVEAPGSSGSARSTAPARAAARRLGIWRSFGVSTFPDTRLRRLRRTDAAARARPRDARSTCDDFVMPLFVGPDTQRRIPSCPRSAASRSRTRAARPRARETRRPRRPPLRDPGRRRTRKVRARTTRTASCSARSAPCARPRTCSLITDVCLCEYTIHGHCGVLDDGDVATTSRSSCSPSTAVSHAEAGADIVAPSDMMDGRVRRDPRGARRRGLRADRRSWPTRRSTPPRSTARSARRPTPRPPFGDRRGYQMDPAQRPRGDARERARRRRGRRHAHGQAGAAVPRRDPRACASASTLPVAAYNVSRRVRDGEGRRRRTAGSTSARRARDAASRSGAPAPT